MLYVLVVTIGFIGDDGDGWLKFLSADGYKGFPMQTMSYQSCKQSERALLNWAKSRNLIELTTECRVVAPTYKR